MNEVISKLYIFDNRRIVFNIYYYFIAAGIYLPISFTLSVVS